MFCRLKTKFVFSSDRSGGTEKGQIALGALLVFTPCLVLLLSLINVSLVTRARVQRQFAADTAALSAAGATARTLNLMSTNNIQMSYMVSEAIAQQAALATLPALIAEANVGANLPIVGPFYAAQSLVLTVAYNGLRATLPALHRQPNGVFFVYCRALQAANSALATSQPVAQLQCAQKMASTNGARVDAAEFLVRYGTAHLEVSTGRESDLLNAAIYGSAFALPDGFKRGYAPIVGLPRNVGPMTIRKKKWRNYLNVMAPLLIGFAGVQYDIAHSAFLISKVSAPGAGFPRPMAFDKLGFTKRYGRMTRPADILAFRNKNRRTIAVTSTPERLFGSHGQQWFEGFGYSSTPIRAYATAEVYNGTSWDLYTEDWRVRLVPNAEPTGLIAHRLRLNPTVDQWLITH